VRVDPLQRLHTLANLAELLGAAGAGVPGVPRTLRDSQLLTEADRIREARPGCPRPQASLVHAAHAVHEADGQLMCVHVRQRACLSVQKDHHVAVELARESSASSMPRPQLDGAWVPCR